MWFNRIRKRVPADVDSDQLQWARQLLHPSSLTSTMEDDTNSMTLSDLLNSPRPLTATATATPTSSSTATTPHRHSTTPRVLSALPRPAVLVGTITLPSPSSSPCCSCLRFSDASASFCCDLLHFRPAALNAQIRVTAWNFLPFKRHHRDVPHGLLEIIDWRFSDPHLGFNAVDSLPLVPPDCRQSGTGGTGARSVHGVVESVGPVSVVPCTMAANSSDLNSGSKVNLQGFLVQLLCCECRLCGSKELLADKFYESREGHSFTKLEIVYFCGNASSWHPVITKMIGNWVVVSGLKKKVVYVTKEESHVMFVTVDESVLHVGFCSEKCAPSLKVGIKGKGECGAYTGVVKGVYMQGMVLELDHDVWLLLTDQLHTSIHGLRVGSIISVRNVHFVNPKFSWTKVIILGACIKTSIIVQSFSPLETVCNVVLPSTGMLGKFIQSLPFSARLWVLLLVSSFRKMFARILSDKEILGSKHKEGLVQMYASSLFPPSASQTQHGAFAGLCAHNLNGCTRELHCGFLKLVIPMSIFICHCIHTLIRLLKSEDNCKLFTVGNHFSILSREVRYNGRSVRRIVRSEDVGFVLLGYLKIDPSTRRLRLVDATGGIDIVIPDLPLTWNPNEIYELSSSRKKQYFERQHKDIGEDRENCWKGSLAKYSWNDRQPERHFLTSKARKYGILSEVYKTLGSPTATICFHGKLMRLEPCPTQESNAIRHATIFCSDAFSPVTDYDVIVDGIGELVDQFELLGGESLSCRTIFDCNKAERELSTSIFVYCHWKNAKCRKIPLHSCINNKNETETLEPGSYHLLRVSHKFPLQEKYSNKTGSSNSSTFVEAILLPFNLLLAGKSRIAHPCNVSWDKTKELSKDCISGNDEDKVSIKRQKLIKELVSLSKDEFYTSIYELSACSNSFRKSEENKKCVNLTSSHDVSCLVTFTSLQKENVVCPAILRSTSPLKDTKFNSKPTLRKVLLEFSSDRFLKHQSMQIGNYYIIDQDRKDCFSSTKDADFGSSNSAKLFIDSEKRMWSLSFKYNQNDNLSDYQSEYRSAEDSSSLTIDEVPKDQKLLPRSNSEPSGVCSDVCLYLPNNLADALKDSIMETEDSANLSLGTGAVVARPNSCFGSQRSNSLFPEGNLISLEGKVVDIHEIGSGVFNSCSSGANLDALQLKGLIGARSSFCIHVLVHHHIVNIFGSVNKHAFPTGFGPGVTATFHRILNARAQNKFMLLPVSFIVIKSIKLCDRQCSDRSTCLNPTKDAENASQDSISYLISQLPQSLSHKQIVLRCRVVAVLVLVVERKTTNFIAETKINGKGTLLDIPLACFLIEDGSSSCCCWANAERAATLLRLREEHATSSHLGRILKNHKKVTVKHSGLHIDSPYQDLVVSVTSGNALCSSDENLIKLIIFNACVGRIWNVVASGMDAEEMRWLEKEYLTDTVNVQSMQNIWAKEVSYPRIRAEARNMIQKLLKS